MPDGWHVLAPQPDRGDTDDADTFAAYISRIGPVLEGIDRRRTFVDGNEVCTIVDYRIRLSELWRSRSWSGSGSLRGGLQEMGVPVELFIYPGMGHPITRPRENHAVMHQNLVWFLHYLLGDDLKF